MQQLQTKMQCKINKELRKLIFIGQLHLMSDSVILLDMTLFLDKFIEEEKGLPTQARQQFL